MENNINKLTTEQIIHIMFDGVFGDKFIKRFLLPKKINKDVKPVKRPQECINKYGE